VFNVSPIIRLSVGLILLTISLLLISDMLGLTPDQERAEVMARKVISEALAAQVSSDVSRGRPEAMGDTLKLVQERNDSVLSAALRTRDGRLLATAGDHIKHWVEPEGDSSTASHVRVPIFDESGRWGTLEVSFPEMEGLWASLFTGGSIGAVILFVGLVGFVGYWLFLKRALNELDPSSVVPDRVRAALDALAEGLVIVDRTGRVVLANAAFESKLGQNKEALVGNPLAALTWEINGEGQAVTPSVLPWQVLLDSGEVPPAAQLQLLTPAKERVPFGVNCSPVKAPDGSLRGAVVTFDDLTELEHKNADLQRALQRLEHSQHEITRQNRELQVLATRDPLTGVLNRRSLFDGMAALQGAALAAGEPLSVIMVDIDHFKSINDRFGHATGDKVIKMLANILTESVRAEDLVGRYGGEEFCVALPGVDETEAARIAERMRVTLNNGKSARFTSALRISASFGVATDTTGRAVATALVDQADKALYQAKEAGRNRVVCWTQVAGEHEDGTENAVAMPAPQPEEVPDSREVPVSPAVDAELLADNERLRVRIVELESLVGDMSGGELGKDDATGLPNRIVLLDRIGQGIIRGRRDGTRLAILSIEIDTVNVVRNTRGSAAADKLMKLVGERLRHALRAVDTVALPLARAFEASMSSAGSGEFTVVLSDIRDAECTTWIVQRLLAAIEETIEVEGNEMLLDGRIGVSLFPADGEDPDVLLANSAAALREAKAEQGRQVCLFYSKTMNQRSKEQLYMETQLHKAIERGEMYLEYQPVVDMSTGLISSFEALLRWRHPDLGMVRPARFIAVAEHGGLIDGIGDWVVQTAARQLKSWHEMGTGNLSMAINFSAFQFRRPDLVIRVVSTLQEVGLDPSAMIVEITESALIQNLDTAIEIVNGLSQAGMNVALDDFGTGYSSLSYLKRFPIDVLKIDRSFLRDFPTHPGDTEIVSAIIAIGHSLGMRVVAEGVETERQLQVLHNMQCDAIQGYLLSKPVSREQATAMLLNPSDIRRLVTAAGRTVVKDLPSRESAIAGIMNESPRRGFVG